MSKTFETDFETIREVVRPILEAKDKEIAALKAAFDRAVSDRAFFFNDNERLDKEIDALKAAFDRAVSDRAFFFNDNERLDKEIDALKAAFDRAVSDRAFFFNDNERLDKEIDALKAAIKTMGDAYEDVSSEAEHLESLNESKNTTIDALKAEIERGGSLLAEAARAIDRAEKAEARVAELERLLDWWETEHGVPGNYPDVGGGRKPEAKA